MKTKIVILVIGVALAGLSACSKTNEVKPRKCDKSDSTSGTGTATVSTETRN